MVANQKGFAEEALLKKCSASNFSLFLWPFLATTKNSELACIIHWQVWLQSFSVMISFWVLGKWNMTVCIGDDSHSSSFAEGESEFFSCQKKDFLATASSHPTLTTLSSFWGEFLAWPSRFFVPVINHHRPLLFFSTYAQKSTWHQKMGWFDWFSSTLWLLFP